MSEVQAAIAADKARIKRLEEALCAMRGFAREARKLLDDDLDMKCLKLLFSMSGRTGYRHDVDKALDALEDE